MDAFLMLLVGLGFGLLLGFVLGYFVATKVRVGDVDSGIFDEENIEEE
jgi:uncharacterized protein YneF (UPF0154 family)